MTNEVPTRHGFAEIHGAQLYYEVAGGGKAIVLVHAGIADHRMWDDQFLPFAKRYQVIRFDLRGFGESSAPTGPFSFHDDLHYLLDQLGITRAVVIGASLGGATAIDLALAYPEVVEALVLAGSGLGGQEWPEPTSLEQALFTQLDEAVKAGDYSAADDMEVHIWVDGPERSPERVSHAVRERVREMNLPILRREAESEGEERRALEPPAGERLGEIAVPTLVLIGDQDVSAIQAIAEKLATTIPGARKVVLTNTAHVPNMEQPEVFNRLVLEFLGSLDSLPE
jgi:pimeloyl-ACP methyl ester carboxylesterase